MKPFSPPVPDGSNRTTWLAAKSACHLLDPSPRRKPGSTAPTFLRKWQPYIAGIGATDSGFRRNDGAWVAAWRGVWRDAARSSIVVGHDAVLAAALALTVLSGSARAEKIANPVAVFAGLDKITGRIISFDVYIDETVQFGALQVTPRVCFSRPPTEPPQTDAFVEVDEITLARKVKRIFNGWMFAASPGLHAVDHAVYDVWLTECKQSSPVAPPKKLSAGGAPAKSAEPAPPPAPAEPQAPPEEPAPPAEPQAPAEPQPSIAEPVAPVPDEAPPPGPGRDAAAELTIVSEWSCLRRMQSTQTPHGEALGRAPTVEVGCRASSGRASNHAQRRCRFCSRAVPRGGSSRICRCVVRGSPPGRQRTRVLGRARLAPHHEGVGVRENRGRRGHRPSLCEK